MIDFRKYLLDEFLEDYSEGRLSRRDALKLVTGVVGSLTLATTLLAGCAPASSATPSASGPTQPPGQTPASTTPANTAPTATGAPAIHVPENDPAIKASMAQFPGAGGTATLMGYLAQPAGNGPFYAVLVCHENRGLTDYIKDVARRLAKAGYVALAVDLLSRQGGTAAVKDQSQIPGMLSQMPADQFVQDFEAGWHYLQSQPFVLPKGAGMVGFCFGGGVTWLVAAKLADLKAAVPFYGPLPPVAAVPGIQAAILGIYGGLDKRITGGVPPIEAAMKQNGKTFEKIVYPDANHAFHNDTGASYNAADANDAWSHALDWFAKYLGKA